MENNNNITNDTVKKELENELKDELDILKERIKEIERKLGY